MGPSSVAVSDSQVKEAPTRCRVSGWARQVIGSQDQAAASYQAAVVTYIA